MLVLGGCIHNLGYLNGVAMQPEPVLGPEIARATANAILVIGYRLYTFSDINRISAC